MKWINRNRKLLKYISVLMIFSLLMDLVAPLAASALTNGPGQVEVQSFEPAATTQMVNLFTGDFVYNIPLMDVGGYPINIAYHAGIGMEQEASWVGLGWNINPGAVSRNMRGLPDDFKGDPVTKILNFKDNVTKGILAGTGFQFTLWKLGVQVDIGLGAFMNTYRGAGFEAYTNATAGIGWLKAGLGISYNTQSGLGINPSLGFSGGLAGGTLGLGGQLSTSYNTREGVKYFSFGGGASVVGIPSRGSTQISLGTQTYTPRIPFNMKSRNSAIRGAVGPFVLGAFPYFFVKGYSSRNFLDVNTKVLNGYGYLYTEAGVDNPDALLDFNREKEGNFTDETPNLPITNFTYDVYTATAQGMGGMYRPHRNEIGTLSDPRMSEDGSGWTTNLDAGFGDIVHAGVGQAIVFTSGFSEKWQGSTNPAGDRLKFQDEGSADYETYYFKNAGEKTIFDETFYTPYGGIKPIKVKIELDNKNIVTLNQFKRKLKDKVYSTLAIPANNYQTNREKRNQLFTFLNADDASNFGLTKRLRTYTLNTSYQADTLPYDTLSRVVNRKRAKHHISEVTILRPDGNKYVYGIPVYTYGQEEVSFNISANPQIFSCDTGLIAYTHDGSKADNSLKNDNGVDNFYSKTIIPPYATSFLLTAVLSSDYVDVSGNGPTDDDLGNFTKINYTRVIGNDAGATNYYEWRIPFSEKPPTNNHYPKATFSEGFKSNKKDDLAHYLHGKKEIWHVHSIETKNFIAEFTLEDRDDGFGVKGENGEINTSKSLKRLKEINLYNKEDRISGFAVPIKTVHFEYDYSLCTGVFNNKNYDPNSRGVANRGKLTLKKIYFTYGKSNRGKLSPYRFHYADNDHNGTIDANPNYNPMDMDRWGVYKPNNCTLTNADYPYAEQDQATANDNAVSWCLTSIDLPSGSTMEITYESDDYAYVQNKRAMQMFKIKGIGQSSSSPLDKNRLHPGNLAYIFFEIDTLLSGSNLKDSLRLKYFEGIKYLYFKCLVDLTGKTDVEYVPGYAEIDDYGVYGSSPYTHAWVKLKPVGIKDDGKGDKVNPIVKAAIQFTRLNLPRLIYPDVDSATCGNIFSCLKQSISIDIQTIFGGGLNEALMDEGYAEALGLDKSWIRLLNPNKKKLGGGLRVSKITMDDSWSTMGGSSDFTYGQTYNYTRKEGGVWISSGVAAYEPIIGNEENPFRQPVFFDIKNVLAPDDHHYQEEPFGESHFPAPIVGYKVVRVTNLQHENVNRTATGYVQYQFYTAKDFPTFTHKTDLSPVNLYFKANPLQFLLRIRDRDYKGVSQGFTIEKNNMHGKLKARKTFAEDQNWPISSIQYFYKTDPLQSNLLSNKASVIFKDGTIGENTIGQDMEIVSDMTFKETNLNTYDFESSFNVFYLGVILSNFSIAFSDYHARTRFQSTVMTKVINRYALLDRIITNELGSISTFRNLAYDANTGEVLLTSKENEFEDPIYNFTHPVHWAYDRMGQAYKNIGVRFKNKVISSGQIIIPDAEDYFVEGDELKIVDGGVIKKLWVFKVIDGVPDKITVIKADGNYPANATGIDISIIRSGRRNQQLLSLAQSSLLKNPISPSPLAFDSLLYAASNEFSEQWGIFCDYDIECKDTSNFCTPLCTLVSNDGAAVGCGVKPDDIVNPYLLGIRGNWRLNKNYTYYVNRLPSIAVSTNTREDGTFTSFIPFWEYHIASKTWVPVYNPLHPQHNPSSLYDNWMLNSEITVYSPHGRILENMDLLNRYTALIDGYDKVLHNLPVAIANNARYRQIAYDGFEDFDYRDDAVTCALLGHWNFKKNLPASFIDNTQWHTGKHSLKLTPGSYHSVSREIIDCSKAESRPGPPYYVQPCDCIDYFAPDTGFYVINLWVKENPSSPATHYEDAKIRVYTRDALDATIKTYEFKATGPVIESWQQIEDTFYVSPATKCVVVKLMNEGFTDANYDDIRIHPFKASMLSFVYDPLTLRMMAELDEYNFATIYEYDNDGNLVRVKEETEKGIITKRETRTSIVKN